MSFQSLSDLKKSRGGFDKLVKEVEKLSNPSSNSQEDNRFWQPEVDKVGNGYAVIRFLPPAKGEDLPWVRIWSHGFKGPSGKWYIENSLTTIGMPDPVSDLNNKLWNSGNEADKEVARAQKRKLLYISNILVVSDPAHPENEGKVFLFKYGKKIFDKIKDVADPQFQDEQPVNPFDFWDGANFKLKIRTVEGYRNYDKSEFSEPSPIASSDDEIAALWDKQHPLKPFVDPANFKSYEELKKRLDMVLSSSIEAEKRAEEIDIDDAPVQQNVRQLRTQKPSTPAKRSEVNFDDDEESMSYFAKLANDD